MNIKIKKISQNNGYINFTAVLENGKEYDCCSMYKDVDIIDSNDISPEINEKIYNFGKKIKSLVSDNTNEFLSTFEDTNI